MSPVLSWNLRERSSFIYRVLHILDCSLVCAFLWALVMMYRVPWTPYYKKINNQLLIEHNLLITTND